jgi:hypothetical protein
MQAAQEAAGHDVFFAGNAATNAFDLDTGVKYLKSLGNTTSYSGASFTNTAATTGGR